MNKLSMNLRQMYEGKMTPERKVEAFRRFVIRLKQKKSFGRDLNYYDYIRVDTALFREEALYMKDLDVEYDMTVRLTKEIRCLEEMTDEQILCYYTLVKRFRKNILERASMTYARYYMLEVVNLVYQETAEEAYEVLFAFWDALNGKKKVSPECTDYFYQICQLFLLARPELMPQMIEEMERRTGRDWSGRTLARIELGDYREAVRFVTQYARLVKTEEIWSETEEARHARGALPYVFACLEKRLLDYDFRKVILNGFYGSMYMGDYPVQHTAKEKRQIVSLSKYRYYEYQEYSDYWKFWYYVLRESVQDLLNLIWQYTRSHVQAYIKLKASKRSAVRILKKNYAEGADRRSELAHLKEMAADVRFDMAVEEGVRLYLEEHQVPLPKKASKRPKKPKKQQDVMDYEEIKPAASVDQEKLKKAKEDADSVLGMLSEGEIDYEGAAGTVSDTKRPAAVRTLSAAGNLTAGREPKMPCADTDWSTEEKRYLQLLRSGSAEEAKAYLHTRKIPEQVMMKQINEKALTLLGDLLLERTGDTIMILEDYEKEADEIIRKAEL